MSGQCNHVWRNGSSPVEQKTERDLSGEIALAAHHGYWLRGSEPEILKKLIEKGTARMCDQCGQAAFSALFANPENLSQNDSD